MKKVEITLNAQEQKELKEEMKVLEEAMEEVRKHSSSIEASDKEIQEAFDILRLLYLQQYTAGKITFDEEEEV